MIYGNKVGGSRDPKTYIIEGNGVTLTGVIVDDLEVLDACCADVVFGKRFACDEGIMTGSNDSPSCRVVHGIHEVAPGVEFLLTMTAYDQWNYTIFHGFITSKDEPNKVEKVIINNAVYDLTGTLISNITKDSVNKTIRLNITNDSAEPYLLHFFVCKEE